MMDSNTSSLIATSNALVARAGSLISELTGLAAKYKKAHQTATQLASRLEIFNSKLCELDRDIKEATDLSPRAQSTLRPSLSACDDAIGTIEQDVASVNHRSKIRLKLSRSKSLWDENAAKESSNRLKAHIQMLDMYIQVVKL